MNDMPDNIWAIHVHIDNATWYECPVPDTEKYIRADIHEAKIKELEAHVQNLIDASSQECGCGYDNPTDTCIGHSAATKALLSKRDERIKELEAQVSRLEKCRAPTWSFLYQLRTILNLFSIT